MKPTVASPAQSDAYPSTRWLAMAILLIASFMNLLDVTIVNVALPTMRESLDATPSGIEWVVAAYTLAFALGLLPFGRLGDSFGRRRMFIVGVLAFTIASALCGIAPDIKTLIAARALQGFAGSIMAPQTLAIAQQIFPPHERGAAFALFGLTASLAAVTGPIVGGLLIEADLFGLDWRPIFLVNIPVGLLAIAAGLRLIPPLPSHRGIGIDPVGILFAGAAVFLVIYPLIEGRGYGWPLWCFAMMAAAVPVAVAFVSWQNRQASLGLPQLMPASLLHDSGFLRGALLSTLFFSCIPGFFLVMAVFLQSGFGLTPLQSGLTNLPFSIGIMIASIASGRLGSGRLRLRILVGALVMLLGMAWVRQVTLGVGDAIVRIDFVMPLFLAGIGMGTAVGPIFQAALAGINGRDVGSASGGLQAIQQAGGAFGVAIMGEMFFSSLETGIGASPMTPHPVFVASAVHAFVYVLVALSLVAAGAFLLRREGPVGAAAPTSPRPGAE